MKKITFIITLIIFLTLSGKADAAIITFDDIDTGPEGVLELSFNYHSAVWDGFYVMEPDVYNPQYVPAISSPSRIAFNGYGGNAGITFDTPVNIVGANFTSAYYEPNNISINGLYSDGSAFSYDNFFTLSVGEQLAVNFGLYNVSSIEFQADNYWYGMDDLEYEFTPVPEPSAMILGLISLIGLLGAGGRKT